MIKQSTLTGLIWVAIGFIAAFLLSDAEAKTCPPRAVATVFTTLESNKLPACIFPGPNGERVVMFPLPKDKVFKMYTFGDIIMIHNRSYAIKMVSITSQFVSFGVVPVKERSI